MTVTWQKVSGPGTVRFVAATSLRTTATFSRAGTYQLRLRASDGSLVFGHSPKAIELTLGAIAGDAPSFARRAEIAALCWRLSGNDPDDLEFEHLPSFEVDVVRRWPSVEKAERMLGWKARIGVEEGIAATVAWLREREGVMS